MMQGSHLSLKKPDDYDHRRSHSQIKPNKYSYAITVSDIALNTSGKSQYPGEQVKYTVPDSRAYTYKKDRYQTMWTKEKQSKETYVDKIFANGKKPEKSVPGPGVYSPDKIAHEMPREFS